ncbi:MAG: hypothetical protein ACPLSJ_04985 [Thermosulfidibacteraceae bacterium]|jgi:DNA mismatch repair protein MutL
MYSEGFVFSAEENKVGSFDYDRIAIVACSSAVKGGDRTTVLDAREVIEIIRRKGYDITCPHGRPVVVRLKRTE